MFDTTFKIAILEVDFKEDNIFIQAKYTSFLKTVIVISYAALNNSFEAAKCCSFHFCVKGEFNLNLEIILFEQPINITLKCLIFYAFKENERKQKLL